MNNQPQKATFTWQQRWIRILSTVLTAAIMIGLFIFSHQGKWESEKSSEPLAQVIVHTGVAESTAIKQVIAPVIHTDEELPVEQQAQQIARKLGHILIFAALGFWLRICLESWFGGDRKLRTDRADQAKQKGSSESARKRILTLWAVLIGVLYGASDELHQSFVPARSAELHDVLVDAIGVAVGVLIAVFVMKFIERRAAGTKKTAEA